jgi:hypothetical protein
VKRGRVLSDDEAESSAAEEPPKRRKSEGVSDRSFDEDTSDSEEISRVNKGKKAAAESRAAKAKIDEDLKNLMLGSDGGSSVQILTCWSRFQLRVPSRRTVRKWS